MALVAKIQIMSSRYDLNNSGSIESGEMINVMKAIYSMVDGNVSEAISMERVTKSASNIGLASEHDAADSRDFGQRGGGGANTNMGVGKYIC